MNPESVPPSEKFLGRLINLREQLTGKDVEEDTTETFMPTVDYCAIIDDLDDIIRSIQRSINTKEHLKLFEEAKMIMEPDSEDTERRKPKTYTDRIKELWEA